MPSLEKVDMILTSTNGSGDRLGGYNLLLR